MKQYQQCRLRKDHTETTGWIEERGAKEGATVEILKPEEMAGDWEVVKVYDTMLGETMLKEHQKLNRKSFKSIEPMS